MNKRLITVGHSPDPDDAFMFYALAHDKLDTGDLAFFAHTAQKLFSSGWADVFADPGQRSQGSRHDQGSFARSTAGKK